METQDFLKDQRTKSVRAVGSVFCGGRGRRPAGIPRVGVGNTMWCDKHGITGSDVQGGVSALLPLVKLEQGAPLDPTVLTPRLSLISCPIKSPQRCGRPSLLRLRLPSAWTFCSLPQAPASPFSWPPMWALRPSLVIPAALV